MSHSLSPVTKKDVEKIVLAEPFVLPTYYKIIATVFILFGVFVFAREAFFGGDVKHAWTAFQVNLLFWFCMAAASSCFTAVFHICNAQWVRPIRRLFEAGSDFFAITPFLFLFVLLAHGYSHIFAWSHEEAPGKAEWLKPNAVYIRDFIGICVLVYLSRTVVKLSIKRDILAVRDGLTGIEKDKVGRWYDKKHDYCSFIANCSGHGKSGIEHATHKMWRLSPAVVIVYALVMSLIAFDQEMSVDYHWYSTMFGGFVFMGAVYIAFAWVSMSIAFMREIHPLFKAKIERRTLHDLGKLLFGFGIFWAYLFWSQYLPIWYGNMHEETAWIILRLRDQPWHDFAWIVFGLCFIIPFLLGLSRDVKQVPILLLGTGTIVACGMWLQHYLLFVPTLYQDHIPLDITEVAIALGFFGAYVLCFCGFLARVPLMPFGDLYLDTPNEPLR